MTTLPRPSIALLVLGFALYAFYFGYTGPELRNPDAASHLAYVRILAESSRLPAATDCSVCHHPPLYYVVAAAAYRGAEAIGVPPARGAQAFSLVLVALFAVTSAFSIARLLPRGYMQTIATALVVFWPSTVTSAARINNDVGFYALATLCFYFLVRFWQAPERKWLLGAGLVALAGLFVKANALILVALVVALAALRAWRDADWKRIARTSGPVLAALLALASLHGFARGARDGSLARNVLGAAYKTAPAELDRHPASYYLGFEPVPFVRVPYADVEKLRDGEPRFWNHWLKSSLFGTRNRVFALLAGREPAILDDVARALNACLLGLLGLSLVGLAASFRKPSATRLLASAAVGVFAAFALGFHVLFPAAHHADFRFAFPVIVPASVLFAELVGALRRRRIFLWHAGYLLTELVVALSIGYFVLLSSAASSRSEPPRSSHATRRSSRWVPGASRCSSSRA